MKKKRNLSSTTTTASTSTSSSSSTAAADTNNLEKRYRGVRKRKWGKWVSEIRLPNSRERIWLGSYDSPEKAARAFDAAMFCLRGRKAAPRFNFPHTTPDIPRRDGPMTPADIQLAAANFANHQLDHTQPPHSSSSSSSTSTTTESDNADPWEAMDWSFLDSLDTGFTATVMDELLYDQLCLPAAVEEEQCYNHSSLWNF